jgi:hypothetical protein
MPLNRVGLFNAPLAAITPLQTVESIIAAASELEKISPLAMIGTEDNCRS